MLRTTRNACLSTIGSTLLATPATGRLWMLVAALLAFAPGLLPAAHAQKDPPGCFLNSLVIGVGRPNEFVKDGDDIPYTVTVSVPDSVGFECTVLLDRITFFSPANPPNAPQTCDADNGVDLETAVLLEPGESARFSGANPPPPGFIFDPNLLYTVNHADEVDNPDPNSDGALLVARACASGTAFTGSPPGIAEAQNNISTTVLHPAVDIVKTPNPARVCEGQGQDVQFLYQVSIPQDAGMAPPDGDTRLEMVSVTDDGCGPVSFVGGDTNGNMLLDFNETWTFSCTTFIDSETTNTATVNAQSWSDLIDPPCPVSDTAMATVTTNAPPPCDITADPICDGAMGATASVPDAGAGATYDWTVTGGMLVSGQNTPTITYNHTAGQALSISVEVTDDNGCTCMDSVDVTILPDPDCTITAPPICELASGTASVLDAGPGATYLWNVTNGTIDDGQGTPMIEYTHTGGAITITVEVTNDAGCTCMGSTGVDFNANPDCTITAPPVCDGGTGTASVPDAGPGCTYLWTTVSADIVSGQNTPSITYEHIPGASPLLVSVQIDCGGCTCDSGDIAVIVNPNPDCSIMVDPVCDGSSGNMASVIDAGAGATYDWSVTGGMITAGQNTPQITFSHNAGEALSISISITDDNECMCTDMVDVPVNENPPCSIDGPESVCQGTQDHVYTYDGAAGNFSFMWSVSGEGNIDGADNLDMVTVDAKNAGTYTVNLTVTDNDTGCTSMCALEVEVGGDLTCEIDGPGNVCIDSVTEFCGPLGLATYQWSIAGDGVIVGPDDQPCVDIMSAGPGQFTLTLVATDDAGCECTEMLEVDVNDGPNFELIPEEDCVAPSDVITVTLRMTDVAAAGVPISGFTAYVTYDDDLMVFLPGMSDYTDEPFGAHLPIVEVQPGILRLSAAIQVFPPPAQQPTTMDADLAVLKFAALDADCEDPNFDFTDEIQPNQLADENGEAIFPCLIKSEPVLIDGEAPRIEACCNPEEIKVDGDCQGFIPDLTMCDRLQIFEECTPMGDLVITQFPEAGEKVSLQNAQEPLTVAVTITVTDCAGNTAACQTDVTFIDNIPPEITCPADRTLKVDNDCVTRVPDFTDEVMVDDNCDNPTLITIMQDPPPDTEIGLGNTTVTLTATDNFGNQAMCTVRLEVIDSTPPKIVNCPDGITLKVDQNCVAPLPDLTQNLKVFDNCRPAPLLDVTQDPPAGTVLPPGMSQVTITVTDNAGLSDSCTVDVTVLDNLPPMITCPGPAKQELDENCQAVLDDYRNGATVSDNCNAMGEITVTQDPPPGQIINGVGSLNVTLTAMDLSGNTATCAFVVETNDNEDPFILMCSPMVKIPADENCEATMPQMTAGVVAGDNCTAPEDLVVTQDPPFGDPIPLGRTTVTITVMDESGNTASCYANVAVNDITPPTITCMNVMAECDPAVPGGDTWVDFPPIMVEDNCHPDPMVSCERLDENGEPFDPPVPVGKTGGLFPVGRSFVRCTVSDGPNQASCIFSVNVVDTTPPMINDFADGLTVKADGLCKYTLGDLTGMVDAKDDCDDVVVTQSPPAGSMFNGPGNFSVTFTATDGAGNTAQCKASIEVVDNTPPVVNNCPNGLKIKANNRCLGQVPTFTGGIQAKDNCDDPGDLMIEQDPPPGTMLPTGTHPITIVVTDSSGNVGMDCVVMLEINDQTPPDIFDCGDDEKVTANADCLGVVPDMTGGVVATDNCTDMAALDITQDPAAGSLVPLGSNPVTISVEDEAGNVSMCTLMLVVNDQTPPVLTCPDDIEEKTPPELCSVSLDPGQPEVEDNCDDDPLLLSQRSDGLGLLEPYPLGETTITWMAIDAAGNVGSCEQTVTVLDNEPPVITCPPNIEVNADLGECEAQVDPGDASARDSCDTNVQVTPMRSDGMDLDDPYPNGETTITWTAEDNEGNTATCQQTITVNAMNTLVVDVEISDLGGSVTRCIEFTLLDCDTNTEMVVVQDLLFNNGEARNVTVKVPCGFIWDCIQANDVLHTVRRADTSIEVSFGQFEADFTDDNRLVSGDVNNDGHVDILDQIAVGNQNGMSFGDGDTPCGTAPIHADLNGDGVVNQADSQIVSLNFETKDVECVCDGVAGDSGPLLAVPVSQLADFGLAEAAWMDVTGDGIIDHTDLVLIEQQGLEPPAAGDFADTVQGRVVIDSPGARGGDVTVADGSSLSILDGSLDADSLTVGAEAGEASLVEIDGTGHLATAGALVVGRGGDGTLLITNGAAIHSGGATLGLLSGSFGEVYVGDQSAWISDGVIDVGVDGAAMLTVAGDGLVAAPALSVGIFGELTGDGLISGDVVSSGLVRPGLPAGDLTIDGGYRQEPAGAMVVTVDTTGVSRLVVGGHADLDGMLTVVADGVQLRAGDELTVLEAAGIAGSFASVQVTQLDASLRAVVVYGEQEVIVRIVPVRAEQSIDSLR